jgi:ElaB/YqjD/DUF883 family membrane-anchored ribosome-binding protein
VENESEVIRHQMDATRSAITEKLEALEHQVVDTMHGASAAVNETIGSMKDAVQETVQTVRDSVQGTVDSVKDTFDVERQVQVRPWTMVAGATALGFLGGYLLTRGRTSQPRQVITHAPTLASGYPTSLMGNGATMPPSRPLSAGNTAAAPAKEGTGILESLGKTFKPELDELKGLAVGTLFGLVRDLVTESVPPSMGPQIEEIINGVSTRLGGHPMKGRILPKKVSSEEDSNAGGGPSFAQSHNRQSFTSGSTPS